MGEAAPDLPTGYGQIAYQGYFEASNGKSLISGAALPRWHEQSEKICDAWDAAADAVIKYRKRVFGAD